MKELNTKQIIAIFISVVLIVTLTLTIMQKIPAEIFWVLILIAYLVVRKFFPKEKKK